MDAKQSHESIISEANHTKFRRQWLINNKHLTDTEVYSNIEF